MEVYLKQFAEAQYGYDIFLNNPLVTLGEYVAALDDFQDSNMVSCRGCDGCCYERIPLTIADFVLAKPLVAKITGKAVGEVRLTDWLELVATINVNQKGAIDIILKRNEDYSCYFLCSAKQECSEHLYRPLVCRTHCCLPKSQIAIDIRGDIINAGEDELCRQLLQLKQSPYQKLLQNCKITDYPQSGFSEYAPEDWQQIPLSKLISDENWHILTHKAK